MKTVILLAAFSAVVYQVYFQQQQNNFQSSSDTYSHIILIPLISAYFLYRQKKEIFSDIKFNPIAGFPIIVVGMALYLAGSYNGNTLERNTYYCLTVLSAWTVLVGAFILFYGTQAVKKASFPFIFLAFAIPIPEAFLEPFIHALQWGSAETANGLFQLAGVPVAHDGYFFYLPGLNIEVAEQCSGIRSSISLIIVSVVAGHLFLYKSSKKVVLALSALPIAIVKNGMRIVTLSLLGAYVDRRVLSSELHRDGGILFFLIALVLLGSVLFLLRKSENPAARK